VLNVADAEDLCILADYITDSGAGRLTLDSDINKKLTACRKHQVFAQDERDLIAKEILAFGGNTVANIYRSLLTSNPTISYAELVEDVAKKTSARFSGSDSVQEIEQSILIHLFRQSIEKMPAPKRKQVLDELGIPTIGALHDIGKTVLAGTVAHTAVSLIIAQTVASAMSAQLLKGAAVQGVRLLGSRSITALAGPIGISVAALWAVADLANPAYRVTLPCVVQIAYMRQKYLAALNDKTQENAQ